MGVSKVGMELNLDEQALRYYFGSLPRTLLSLWEAVSGGEDWDRMADPLVQQIGPHLGAAFTVYIAFSILALMNVVTGFFVHTALHRAAEEEKAFVADQIVRLFRYIAEDEKLATITYTDIDTVLTDPDTAKEWKAINVQQQDAQDLFRLLDIDRVGLIRFDDFLSGCLRMSGPAKSMDLLIMMQEARASHRRFDQTFVELEQRFDLLQESLNNFQSK